MAGEILSDSRFSHIIEAPIELIDIPAWLHSLPTEEYKRCSPDHIAAGATFADDGTRMSLNVEMIGGSLLVQNYVQHVREKEHVKLVSITDLFSPNGRTTPKRRGTSRSGDDNSCEDPNHVTASATEPFLAYIKEHGISFEEAAAARQKTSSLHNQGKTPFFAKSIERTALTRA